VTPSLPVVLGRFGIAPFPLPHPETVRPIPKGATSNMPDLTPARRLRGPSGATTRCDGCPKTVSTSWDTFPYCSTACRDDDLAARARRSSGRPSSPGRVAGF
jgi:hypothetical protein